MGQMKGWGKGQRGGDGRKKGEEEEGAAEDVSDLTELIVALHRGHIDLDTHLLDKH